MVRSFKSLAVVIPVMLLTLPGCSETAGGAEAPDAGPSWTLVWADEFEGAAIDPDRWGHDVDCWGGGNAERQCYTDRVENARVEAGVLLIEARRETWRGPDRPAAAPHDDGASPIVERPFTSARLTTRGRASWRYGRFEIRAALPEGQGVWPAIWMLPEDNAYGGWAASGEIDIMEAVNLGTPCESCAGGLEDRILGSLHFGGSWPDNDHSSHFISVPGGAAGFRTYAIEWTPDSITWFVDGQAYARQTPADWRTEGEAPDATPDAPFDKPFHLILNLAIGGRLPETRNLGGVSEAGFPKIMRVDYVRVYACDPGDDPSATCW